MIVLCELCFPRHAEVEVLTIRPSSPCDECGRYDTRHMGGIRCFAFRSDPREKPESNEPETTC